MLIAKLLSIEQLMDAGHRYFVLESRVHLGFDVLLILSSGEILSCK